MMLDEWRQGPRRLLTSVSSFRQPTEPPGDDIYVAILAAYTSAEVTAAITALAGELEWRPPASTIKTRIIADSLDPTPVRATVAQGAEAFDRARAQREYDPNGLWGRRIDREHDAWAAEHPELAERADAWAQDALDRWAQSGEAPTIGGTRLPDTIRPRPGETFAEWEQRISCEYGATA